MIGNDLKITYASGETRTVHISPATVADVARVVRLQDIAGCVMPVEQTQVSEMVIWLSVAGFVEVCAADGLDSFPDFYKWSRKVTDLDLVGATNPTRGDTQTG